MERKTTKKISLILLIGLLIVFSFYIFGFLSYLVSRHENEKRMEKIYQNAKVQELKFKNLDRINSYISKNEINNALLLLDSLISMDNSRIDLYLKRGFVNYKLQRREKAIIDYKYVIDRTTLTIDGQTLLKDKELYYYALIGIMLTENSFNETTLEQYYAIKKNSYLNVSLDTLSKKITFAVDSAIMKQIYD